VQRDRRTRMRIAQVAPLWASVPPVDYGGTELRVSWLTEELVERGHAVTLFASGDSKTWAQLQSLYPRNLMDAMQDGLALDYAHYTNASLAEVIRDSSSYDLIHCHSEVEHIPFGILSNVPFIYSLRTALSIDDIWLLERYPNIVFVAMSRAQITDVSDERRRAIPVIYNGCRFEDYLFSRTPGTYLAFLGRMGRHKNPLGAIQTAQSVKMPIILAGKPQDRTEEAYFEREIRPLINGTDVKYIGPVNQAQKRIFLRDAAALLFPIQWQEPFGIVMIEAMASGTPVIAYNHGSVAEIIEPGVTGFYADSVDELAALVPAAIELDRGLVHQHAKQRFSHMRMVDDYIHLYKALLNEC
jgi:glycosyltransferase involved in cell wall biosynthesis